jgi:hypothetical protein
VKGGRSHQLDHQSGKRSLVLEARGREGVDQVGFVRSQDVRETILTEVSGITAVRLLGLRKELHQFDRSRELEVPFHEGIGARGVDGTPVVLLAGSTETVEVLECEAEGVQIDVVTALATLPGGDGRHSLAIRFVGHHHGQSGDLALV